MNFATFFEVAYSYDDFLQKYGQLGDQQRWAAVHQCVQLTNAQKQLLAGFRRQMKVRVMAGTWCGDCVEQCPIFDHFARESDLIQLRFVDRDDCGQLKDELVVCGAPRVPQVMFISEDDHAVGRYGDRTLSKYRHMAMTFDDASERTGVVTSSDELLAATVQDWLDEFERVQLERVALTCGRDLPDFPIKKEWTQLRYFVICYNPANIGTAASEAW